MKIIKYSKQVILSTCILVFICLIVFSRNSLESFKPKFSFPGSKSKKENDEMEKLKQKEAELNSKESQLQERDTKIQLEEQKIQEQQNKIQLKQEELEKQKQTLANLPQEYEDAVKINESLNEQLDTSKEKLFTFQENDSKKTENVRSTIERTNKDAIRPLSNILVSMSGVLDKLKDSIVYNGPK
jgi:DNA repair exonuclease SbcCD ATPase subunit